MLQKMGVLVIFVSIVSINSFQNYVWRTHFMTSTMMLGVWAYDPIGSTKHLGKPFVN